MSILIKGIDMPRNGDCHHITIYDNGNTYVTTSNVLYETDRKDIKAVQIPAPHGRLIDSDRFIESNECCGWIEDMTVETFNKLTPTILEAEEE